MDMCYIANWGIDRFEPAVRVDSEKCFEARDTVSERPGEAVGPFFFQPSAGLRQKREHPLAGLAVWRQLGHPVRRHRHHASYHLVRTRVLPDGRQDEVAQLQTLTHVLQGSTESAPGRTEHGRELLVGLERANRRDMLRKGFETVRFRRGA